MLRNRKALFRRSALLLPILLLVFATFLYLYLGLPAGPGDLETVIYSTAMGSQEAAATFKFEFVPGFFKQSEADTNPDEFDNAKENFGIIEREFETDDAVTKHWPVWRRLHRYINHLNNQNRPLDIFYKVLYFGRHGEGYHNVAEAFYGTKAWDDYWSKLDGNGTMYWFDAHLTDVGKQQALAAHDFIEAQLNTTTHGMPAPESYYVSPLYRCLQTANLTWGNLTLPDDKRFTPVIKELLREVLGEHTCDKRSTKTNITTAFPDFIIEDGFSEEDLLWKADHRETHEEHDERTKELMTDIFSRNPNTFVSLTSHSGAIASHLRVFGHREFKLPTGGMIPVLVKATRSS
ncbi:hypothetical protein AC578_637 [Pseudocercospora eumusae]|uniref:Uncharacterized protein n=1 Tax=Pseudocercospora eumusae TaxID=321146 RepID=A0A139HKW9_9PEZI|nr:hypothetical protein AC578_637 [Pseudocercospora eumusae]KXT03028.1 hypothetical protein AC578_637 [Pseudocercospora eumusae]KXT03029.1 hypothetical protein AC578_637 [Pseudocercospora eumusae]